MYSKLTSKGFKPQFHKLDNETSHKVEEFIASQNTNLQYVPPDMHRSNAAEKVVQIWKNHFIAGLASLPALPLANWCRLTLQADITLNMLRPCRGNPALSAHEGLDGAFHFDFTSMAPPGTQVFVHIKPNTRKSWGVHALDAWYIAPAMKHYRCFIVDMDKTALE